MALNGPQVAHLLYLIREGLATSSSEAPPLLTPSALWTKPLVVSTATGKATTVELELLFGVADKYFQKRVFYKFLPKFVASGTVRWH